HEEEEEEAYHEGRGDEGRGDVLPLHPSIIHPQMDLRIASAVPLVQRHSSHHRLSFPPSWRRLHLDRVKSPANPPSIGVMVQVGFHRRQQTDPRSTTPTKSTLSL